MLERFLLAGAIAVSLSWFAQLNPQSNVLPVGEAPAPQSSFNMAANYSNPM